MDQNREKLVDLTPDFLRQWPLPQPGEADDKEARGRVLAVGGSTEMPGAVILAAEAALRSGAGKLRIATCASMAPYVATAVPESLVFALPESESGGIAVSAAEQIARMAEQVSAVLIGPGMIDQQSVTELVTNLLPKLEVDTLILDAAAFEPLCSNPEALHHLGGRAIITPHAGEMAHLLDIEKEEVTADPLATAQQAALKFQAVVALKGSDTYIAAPSGKVFRDRSGNVGLATSGSGDALAGIVLGLAGRGAEPQQAAAWASFLHGSAGDNLTRKVGRLGFLARELLAEIPPLMSQFDPPI
ncbi:MAG TPA: NAD(P)H-hydrate dehydratase [Chloroflexia bacterium]|nr:NAD(P)H-hydrate dehydratase [Chloroflexia bacterium]